MHQCIQGAEGRIAYPDFSMAGTWWAVYCKSRQVEALVNQLMEQGIAAYTPLVEREGARKQTYSEPLFPGYGFFAANQPEDIYAVRATKRVVQFVEIKQQRQFIAQISQIALAMSIDPTLRAVPKSLSVGATVAVEVACGTVVSGVVVKGDNRRVWLHMSLLGQAIPVEIDRKSRRLQ